MRRMAFLLLLLPLLAQAEVNFITLKHRNAETLLPLLQPVLDEGVRVSGTGPTLIVNCLPWQMHEVRAVVRQLDTPRRSLLISVMQRSANSQSRLHGSISGNVAQPNVRLYGSDRKGDGQISQQLRVIEGGWATIRAGEAVPIVSERISRHGYGTTRQRSVEYRNVESGYEVRPLISDERVTLEVRPFHAKRVQGHSGLIEQHELHTTVSGRLGEWITIGGGDENDKSSGMGTVYGTAEKRRASHSVKLKVEHLPN